MIIGYTRSFTREETTLQIANLKQFGCDKIYDEPNGVVKEQTELEKLLQSLSPGDKVVVYKLYCIANSTRHLIELTQFFKEHLIDFVSIRDQIDTSKGCGKVFFQFMENIEELKHDVISERTKAGLNEAKLRGSIGGRPRKPDRYVKRAIEMYQSGKFTIAQITIETGISKTTLYRYLEDSNKY